MCTPNLQSADQVDALATRARDLVDAAGEDLSQIRDEAADLADDLARLAAQLRAAARRVEIVGS